MKRILKKTITLLFLAAYTQISFAQNKVQALEPSSKHYQTLAAIDASPNSLKPGIDTIQFPMKEYKQGALTYTQIRTVYLSGEDEKKLKSLISFPATSSAQTRAELDFLLDLQQKRTPEMIANSKRIAQIGYIPTLLNPTDSLYQANLKDLFYIGHPVGEWFSYQNFPLIGKLLHNTMQDIRVTEFSLKRQFMRPRPYHIEPRLHALENIGSPSFPSGHTLFAFTQAYILSEIIPELRPQFLEVAEEFRFSREILGIHYPSDNEQARLLGWHLMRLWMKNRVFAKDLQRAKAEWYAKKPEFKDHE